MFKTDTRVSERFAMLVEIQKLHCPRLTSGLQAAERSPLGLRAHAELRIYRSNSVGTFPRRSDISLDKKLSYRRGTARCVLSVVILPIATQQCRNYLYDKS